MSKQNKDKTLSEPSELDHRIKKVDPMIREAISEYKKEIARLQKQLEEPFEGQTFPYSLRCQGSVLVFKR